MPAKPIPVRPPKVSDEEMRWTTQVVRNHTLQKLRFNYALWTLSLIAQLINREFRKSLSLAASYAPYIIAARQIVNEKFGVLQLQHLNR